MVDDFESGTVIDVFDCGSVVQVVVQTKDGVSVLAADGNLFRRAEGECGELPGRRIRFERTDYWSGLAWFAPLDEDED